MARIDKTKSWSENDDAADAQKKVVVFCTLTSVAEQIAQFLEKKNMRVLVYDDDRMFLTRLESIDPELVFIEVNAAASRPIQEIVAEVFIWMRARARKINTYLNSPSRYFWQNAKIIIFKSDSQITGAGSMAAEIADTDEIIRQCGLLGEIKYIGLYSSFSFMTKIRSYLEQVK